MCLTLSAATGATAAALSGEVDYPALGLTFTIPDGWLGQESESGLVLGSNTEAGLILMNQHPYDSVEALRRAADEGLHDAGVSLSRDGEIRVVGDTQVGAPFSGVFQGQPARAYAIGVLNPRGGGVSVLALSSDDGWSERLAERAWQIADSLSFDEPDTSAEIAEWQTFLSDVRLTYMDSDYSSGASVDGYSTYSGHSTQRVLHLCAAGHYKYGSSSSMSFDAGGGFGHGSGSDQGSGRWQVIGDAHGQPVLRLNGNEGDVFELALAYEDAKTYLDGVRYFRTLPGDQNGYGPDCP